MADKIQIPIEIAYSDVKRVKAILDKLGPEFEVVPLDVFLSMAGAKPTFEERFLKK